jgi:hypothetical protein
MKRKNRKQQRFFITLFVLSLLFLLGCGAGRTMVMKPPPEKVTARAVDLVEEEPTVNVPKEVREKFRENLEKALFEAKDNTEPRFSRGSEIEMRYRFIQFDPGDRFSRWFWGGIGNAGEGTLTVEATFCNGRGEPLSKIQSEGKISSGFFGGSFDFALDKAAREIVQFAEGNFK